MTFGALQARVASIQKLIVAAGVAMRLPDQRRSTAEKVELEYYSQQSKNEALVDAFRAIRARFADEEHRQGEIARDRELKRIASELDRLRADLPDLAASARFDLLDTILEFRK